MEGCGVLYVATQNLRCLAEAVQSATSVKAVAPELPVAVFTDQPRVAGAFPHLFDVVRPLAASTRYRKQWQRGIFDKCLCLGDSPFARTLYLDTDTRVLSPAVRQGFSLLSRHDLALVPCTAENSRSCRLYGRPMFNTGVVFYRSTPAVASLLARWSALSRELFDLAHEAEDPDVPFLAPGTEPRLKRWILQTDQLSLARLLAPDLAPPGLSAVCLEDRWNWRRLPDGSEVPEVVVAHCMEYKVRPEDSPGVLGLDVPG